MSTLILYGTKYGCTEKCAKLLAKKLNEPVDLVNLKISTTVDLAKYDTIIIGGSVIIGKIQKEVTKFCTSHLNELKSKKLGLFICCMQEGENGDNQLKTVFPQELVTDAAAIGNFGGEFIVSKMGFMSKFIVKKVAKVTEDTSNILVDNIDRFAQLLNNNQC